MSLPKMYRFKSKDAIVKFVTDADNGPENTALVVKALGSHYLGDWDRLFYLKDTSKTFTRFELCDAFGAIIPMCSSYSYFSEYDMDKLLVEVPYSERYTGEASDEDGLASINISEQSCDVRIEGRFTKSQIQSIIEKLQKAIQ